MIAGPGHNGGPTMEGGTSWRAHCWGRARKSLLGQSLPVEVIRSRVRRAQELGLDYKTYASVRASTGRDLIGFLFSTNALRIVAKTPTLPGDRAAKLQDIRSEQRICLVRSPLQVGLAEAANAGGPLDGFAQAPHVLASWGMAREGLGAVLRGRKLPGDAVLLVGDDWIERDWAEAARLAGYLSADAYFGARVG